MNERNWIDIKQKLPKEGKYVLGIHNRGTWKDSTDQLHVNYVIVKMIKGISIQERKRMKNGESEDYLNEATWCLSDGWQQHKRSEVYKSCDEHGNNEVPYNFETFGSDTFFGQTITHWQVLPDPPIKT